MFTLSSVSFRLYGVAILVCFGTTFLMYCSVVLNGPVLFLKQFVNHSYDQQFSNYPSYNQLNILWGGISSFIMLGSVCGAASLDVLANRMGRKGTIIVVSVNNIIASSICAVTLLTDSFEVLSIGRFLVGYSLGLGFSISGVFLSEIAPSHQRGTLCYMQEVVLNFGTLLAMSLQLPQILGSTEYFWLLSVVPAIPSIFVIILLPFCPETPWYLYFKTGDTDAVRHSIVFYRGDSEITSCLVEMKEQKQLLHSTISYRQLFSRKFIRRLCVCAVYMVGVPAAGVIFTNVYTVPLLLDAQVSASDAQTSASVFALLGFLATLPMSYLVERYGRRKVALLSIGASILFSLIPFIVFQHLATSYTWAPTAAAVSVVIYYALFCGADGIIWFITAELFDQSARSKAVMVMSVLLWTGEWISELVFYPIMQVIGSGLAMVGSVVIGAGLVVFLYLYMPEPKGTIVGTVEMDAHVFDDPHQDDVVMKL